MPSGYKSLPAPVLTQIYVTIWHQWATHSYMIKLPYVLRILHTTLLCVFFVCHGPFYRFAVHWLTRWTWDMILKSVAITTWIKGHGNWLHTITQYFSNMPSTDDRVCGLVTIAGAAILVSYYIGQVTTHVKYTQTAWWQSQCYTDNHGLHSLTRIC